MNGENTVLKAPFEERPEIFAVVRIGCWSKSIMLPRRAEVGALARARGDGGEERAGSREQRREAAREAAEAALNGEDME